MHRCARQDEQREGQENSNRGRGEVAIENAVANLVTQFRIAYHAGGRDGRQNQHREKTGPQ